MQGRSLLSSALPSLRVSLCHLRVVELEERQYLGSRPILFLIFLGSQDGWVICVAAKVAWNQLFLGVAVAGPSPGF